MNQEHQIQKLLRAKKRLEKKLKDIDQRLEHLQYRFDEERRCMTRHCPLDAKDKD